MHLSLSMSCSCRQVQTLELPLTGGITSTIFPEVEAWLQADHDRQKALKVLADRLHKNPYRSVMDLLVCSVFPELRPGCFRYYLGGGRPLRDLITSGQRVAIAWHLLQAIEAAYQAFCEHRSLSWAKLRQQVRVEEAPAVG
jgi:hypothetical protein